MAIVPVLSAFYFGSVEHYCLLAAHPKVIMDLGEHYVRQSYRSRTSIAGANGRLDLMVPIARRSGEKMPMRTVGLSYAESWPQQHMHALRSAYGRSPWALHFLDEIEEVISKRYDRLVDLDLATMKLGMQWLGLSTEVETRDEYVASDADTIGSLDLRASLHPKQVLPPVVPLSSTYAQVFSDRHGFMPRLSVIDLVCNCGPDALRIVRIT